MVGERGLGAILLHHLGASQRWRHAFQDTGESPKPERAKCFVIEHCGLVFRVPQ